MFSFISQPPAAASHGALVSLGRRSNATATSTLSKAPFDGSTTAKDAYRAWAIEKREPFVPGSKVALAMPAQPTPRFEGISETTAQFVAQLPRMNSREPFVPPTQVGGVEPE